MGSEPAARKGADAAKPGRARLEAAARGQASSRGRIESGTTLAP
ncbi:hypothetical protein [Lysobacter gummosus]